MAPNSDRHQAAERPDREIHLAHAEHDHLREGDEQADADAAQHHIDVELGEEGRRDECRRHRAGDEDRRQAGPLAAVQASKQISFEARPGVKTAAVAVAKTAASRIRPRKSCSQKLPI